MARRIVKPHEESLLDQSFDFFSLIWSFLLEYQLQIFVVACIIVLLTWFLKRNKKKSSEIKKIWIFTLFFLTKRQMMLPLVVSLAKKDGILDEEIREQLLEIRNRCRDVSLKKDPIIRLELEQHVSKILFYYFTNLEEEGKIKKGTKFEKIVKDLEFIDAKLVQLQFVYNREADKWNKAVTSPLGGWLYSISRFHPFEKFEIPN